MEIVISYNVSSREKASSGINRRRIVGVGADVIKFIKFNHIIISAPARRHMLGAVNFVVCRAVSAALQLNCGIISLFQSCKIGKFAVHNIAVCFCKRFLVACPDVHAAVYVVKIRIFDTAVGATVCDAYRLPGN